SLPHHRGRLATVTSLSMLHAEVDGQGPRLVLVHGFSQNRNCWGPMAADLARDHEVVRVDAPGHGRSSAFYAGLRTGARLIADQGGTATYLGYSMGARFLLHLALANPELVRGLVLVGGTAGIDDDAARRERKRVDDAMASRRSSMHGWRSRCSRGSAKTCSSAPSARRTPSTAWQRACDRQARDRRTRCGRGCRGSTCRCW